MAGKQSTAKALRELPRADLLAELSRLRQELWQHRIKIREGAQQQMHQIPVLRRQIARIHTVLKESRTP
ncbi:MAG: 50S ribosomal protein L29 [Candidatus Omnitrophica bacterium]|nr:50S ribosomal protein L29 [Candidatus Omnitrophota bacterium]